MAPTKLKLKLSGPSSIDSSISGGYSNSKHILTQGLQIGDCLAKESSSVENDETLIMKTPVSYAEKLRLIFQYPHFQRYGLAATYDSASRQEFQF